MLDYAFMEKALPFLLKAIPVTLGLTFLVLVLSFLPALFLADRRIRGRGWGEKLITLYISFIRGTPLVLQILLLYALLPSLLHSLVQMAGLSFDVFHGVNPLWYAVIVFTLNTIALMSEIFRSAITSVADGQMEAGLTIGLSLADLPRSHYSAGPLFCGAESLQPDSEPDQRNVACLFYRSEGHHGHG